MSDIVTKGILQWVGLMTKKSHHELDAWRQVWKMVAQDNVVEYFLARPVREGVADMMERTWCVTKDDGKCSWPNVSVKGIG